MLINPIDLYSHPSVADFRRALLFNSVVSAWARRATLPFPLAPFAHLAHRPPPPMPLQLSPSWPVGNVGAGQVPSSRVPLGLSFSRSPGTARASPLTAPFHPCRERLPSASLAPSPWAWAFSLALVVLCGAATHSIDHYHGSMSFGSPAPPSTSRYPWRSMSALCFPLSGAATGLSSILRQDPL